jgi:hypothetical protein
MSSTEYIPAEAGKKTIFLKNPLDFNGDLTAVGWHLPDTLTRNQYVNAGKLLGKMEDSKQWWLGDWWNAGVKWGEGQQICEQVGIPYQTAMNAGSLAKAFQFSRRRENLSVSHHAETQVLPTQELQDRFLDWCLIDTDTGEEREKPKSKRELREAIKNYMDAQAWTESEKQRREIVEQGGTVVAHLKQDENLIRWAQFNNRFRKIDRPSEWSNPFKLNDDGDRNTVCDSYAVYLDLKPSLLSRIEELKGMVLGCWCHPQRCHGDELARRANDED